MLPGAGKKFSSVGIIYAFCLLLFAVYFGFSNIYWLPSISIAALDVAKFLLIATAVLISVGLSLANDSFSIPKGLLGPIGFIAVLLVSVPGLIKSDMTNAIDTIVDLVLSFTFLWCFFILARNGRNIKFALKLGISILALFCMLTITSELYGVPNWQSPFEGLHRDLASNGFGASSTGWSNGIALFFPATILLISIEKVKGWRRVVSFNWFLIVAFSIFGSQIVCGGRAGIVASLCTIILLIALSPSRSKIIFLVLIAALLSFVLQDFLFEQLRLYKLVGQSVTSSNLDSFSTGRVGGYKVALQLIAEQPLWGHGFGQVSLFNYGVGYREVHNLWLKLAVEGGLLLPIVLAVVVGSLFHRIVRMKRATNRDERQYILALGIIVAGGIVISFFEPNTLLGSFQNSAIWWAAAGTLLGRGARQRQLGFGTHA